MDTFLVANAIGVARPMSKRRLHEAKRKPSAGPAEMTIHYYLVLSLFLCFGYALAADVSGVNGLGIEGEYMPPEIATRICYILIVALCVPMYMDARGPKGIVLSPSAWAGDPMPRFVPCGVFVSAVMMLFMENNWDLWIRETFIGTLIFAVPFLLLFLPLLWRSVVRHRIAGIGLISGLLVLAMGQISDLSEGTSVISEELIELFSAVLVLHAVAIVAMVEGGRATAGLHRERYRVLASAVILSTGNAMLLFDHGDMPPIWQLAAGAAVSILGLYLLVRFTGEAVGRSPRRIRERPDSTVSKKKRK